MNTSLLIVASVVSIITGAALCITAFFMSSPERIKKTPIFKGAGFIFYVIGILTLAYGILGLCFYKTVSRLTVALFALIYLIVLIIMFIIFYMLIGDSVNNERDNSQR